MGAHIIEGEFQSDKYPTCPRGKVPLSVKDKSAQDLLWEYAKRRRSEDAEFSADLMQALREAGYNPPSGKFKVMIPQWVTVECDTAEEAVALVQEWKRREG